MTFKLDLPIPDATSISILKHIIVLNLMKKMQYDLPSLTLA